MDKRALGSSGLSVAPLAFGGNVFGWTADEATSFRLLDRFVDEGFNLIDTADVYSRWVPGNQGGDSEEIIGKWLQHSGKRDSVVIATKVGMDMGDRGKGLRKEHILRSAEDSLSRLKTDRIDLYQSHEDDLDTPLEETLAAYDQLLKQGKVRAIGASNYSAERLAKSLDIARENDLPRYQSLQPEYNLYNREGFEAELETLCVGAGIGVICYYSLASGFLTGKYRSEEDVSKSPRGGAVVKKYLNDRGFRILSALDQVAADHDTTPARVALAWLIARPSVTAPIASATSDGQLDDLIASTRLRLDAASIDLLNRASEWRSAENRASVSAD